MAKFRNKPVVIEAFHWTRDIHALTAWLEEITVRPPLGEPRGAPIFPVARGGALFLEIETLDGTMTVAVDDWIIRGVKGEFYPCKPDIFAATYEPVDD